MSALLDGDKAACRGIITRLIQEHVDVKIIYESIIQKSMYRVGYLWDKCRISIADEHIASEITKEMVSLININTKRSGSKGRSVIITCVQKELHDIGPRIIANYFELMGWNSIFIGVNIPDKELVNYIGKYKPDLIGISNSFYMNVTNLLGLLDLVKTQFPDQKIIIGGQGPTNCQLQSISKYADITYIHTLDDLENYINQFN
jgi:methanogenic corrinoid protein MtbC1